MRPTLIFFLVVLPLISGAFILSLMLQRQARQDERNRVYDELELARVKLDEGLKTRIALLNGLSIAIQSNSSITNQVFNSLSSEIIYNDPIIISVSAIKKDSTVYEITSIRKNGSVRNPGDQVRKTYDRDELAGLSVEAYGQNDGLIRLPVYVFHENSRRYWGELNAVVSIDKLVKESGIDRKDWWLSCAVMTHVDAGSEWEVKWGTNELGKDAVSVDLPFPGGDWRIAALPRNGWSHNYALAAIPLCAGVIFSIVIGLFIYFVSQTRKTINDLERFDPVTGLPNAALFKERFDTTLSHAERANEKVGIVMIKAGGTYDITDSLDDEDKNQLAVQISRRLTRRLRKGDTVARYGDLGFITLVTQLNSSELIPMVIRKMQGCFDDPFKISGIGMPIDSRFSVALYPDDGYSVDALLAKASGKISDQS
jgi:diguanylate cyclase (GGDEF)-like protein